MFIVCSDKQDIGAFLETHPGGNIQIASDPIAKTTNGEDKKKGRKGNSSPPPSRGFRGARLLAVHLELLNRAGPVAAFLDDAGPFRRGGVFLRGVAVVAASVAADEGERVAQFLGAELDLPEQEHGVTDGA